MNKRSPSERYAVAAASRLNATAMKVAALARQMVELIDEACETGALEEAELAILAIPGRTPSDHPAEQLVQLCADLVGMRWVVENLGEAISSQTMLTKSELDEIDQEAAARHGVKLPRRSRE